MPAKMSRANSDSLVPVICIWEHLFGVHEDARSGFASGCHDDAADFTPAEAGHALLEADDRRAALFAHAVGSQG